MRRAPWTSIIGGTALLLLALSPAVPPCAFPTFGDGGGVRGGVRCTPSG